MKLFLATGLLLSGMSTAFAHQPVQEATIQFNAENVLSFAQSYSEHFNLAVLESEAGKGCILNAVESLRTGIIPPALQAVYGNTFPFGDNDNTLSVIAHACGGTGYFAKDVTPVLEAQEEVSAELMSTAE